MSTITLPAIQLDALQQRVIDGLCSPHKHLPSDYFYDTEGSRIFQRIMALPEYYLSRAEHRLLTTQWAGLLKACAPDGEAFELIELGSGDGSKTMELCAAFAQAGADFAYRPIDISRHAIESLCQRFRARLPGLKLTPRIGDYFAGWVPPASPSSSRAPRQVAMFMGSNLGNMSEADALGFLRLVRSHLREGDALMLGLDLMKNPHTILAAYNDAAGITAAFNLNLLRRMNRELGMDFVLDRFRHYASYCPLSGTARSFLVSLCRQRVHSAPLDLCIDFEDGEVIYTEQSQKYDRDMIARLARASGFVPHSQFVDPVAAYGLSFWLA